VEATVSVPGVVVVWKDRFQSRPGPPGLAHDLRYVYRPAGVRRQQVAWIGGDKLMAVRWCEMCD